MKAKKHALLSEISGALNGRVSDETFEVLGHKYTLRLGKPEAEDWIAANTDGTSMVAMMNVRKPTLAATLVSIDDVLMEQLFQPGDDVDASTKEYLISNTKELRTWRRGQILDWLREEVDTYVIDTLYAHYTGMSKKHKEAMQELENLSKRTPLPV